MSFIFDALRKSEAARRTQSTEPAATQFAAPRPVLWPWLLVGTGLLIASLIWLGWVMRGTPPATSVPTPTVTHDKAPPVARSQVADPVVPLSEEAETDIPAPVPANTVRQTASPTPASADNASETVPALAALPADFRAAMPALDMQVHAYTGEPGQRFVIINLHRYHEGDRLREGPMLIAIRPDGAVLDYRGRRFLLQR